MALFKNKENDKKRKGENVIGKIIYGFLLFAPLISILFTSLYTVFNKNAFESYYGETINQEQIITLNQNNTNKSTLYYLNVNDLSTVNENSTIFVTNLSVENPGSLSTQIRQLLEENRDNIKRLVWDYGTQFLAVYVYDNNIYSWLAQIRGDYNTILSFNTTTLNSVITQKLYYYEYNNYSYLDNAFEYGMYKTEQSNIYNWSKTTGTYTVMQNVCNGIGITNTFTPMLMAYWLIISIIYFIFDIALILIWAVHDKIHELKDSI